MIFNKNYGVVTAPPRGTDYILGSTTNKINITRMVKDWALYLPILESQANKIWDFSDCTTMSAGHAIEMQLNYLLFTNQLSDEALNFFHNNNYIVDGIFRISKRFNATLNGTEKIPGNTLYNVGDHFRSDGFIPDMMWTTTDNMTWEEFYSPIPQHLIDLGKKALWYITIQYQFISYREDLLPSLYAAPIQVATEVCAGWESGHVVQKCSGQPLQHATIIYGQDGSNNWLNFDQLPTFLQKLAPDYELPLNMQYIITLKPTTLRKGMWGANVTILQEDLNSVGYKLTPDGSFGGITETAVKDFQKKHGLVADGIAGSKTLQKLSDIKDSPSIKDIIIRVCNEEGIEPELGIAVARNEGGLKDPRIERTNTDKVHSIDRGIFQWNSYWNPQITKEMAFDPETATHLFCKAVKAGNLHTNWSASEPNWKKEVSPAILKKYGIV